MMTKLQKHRVESLYDLLKGKGFLFILTVYILFMFTINVDYELYQVSSLRRNLHKTIKNNEFRSTFSKGLVMYSPCHYPVKGAPSYSIDDAAVSTCIASLKSHATEAAIQWPRDRISTMMERGKFYKAQILNYILPTWLCPSEERIGGFTDDGAKWICAPRIFLNKYEKCYIYSFGSNANFEFEDYLARIAQCETHIFDPTPGIRKKLKNITLPDHYHFHFEAFGGQINKELVLEPFGLQSKHLAGPQKFQTKTLDEFVAELHTPYIDILKIDVEGSELNDIYNDDKDSIWRTHRIGQVLIEVHLDFDNDETFQRLFKLFDFLVSNGFVLFHSEWNVHALYAYEFAFIDLDYKSPSSPSYLERLLTTPYSISEENAVVLSDSASLTKYLEGESRRRIPDSMAPLPYYFSTMLAEATYHCHNKVFVGDRSDLEKYFMYLCVDTLDKSSKYVGIYESEVACDRSSIEEALKSKHGFRKATVAFSPSYHSPLERLDVLANALMRFDVVKIDLPNMIKALSLNHIDSQRLLTLSNAKIIHMELHFCEETDYFDLRDRFIKLRQLFQYYGYEIYHKEVTFTENLRQEEMGVLTNVCHVAISWIKRTQ